MSRGYLAAAAAAFTLALSLPAAAQANGFPLVGWWPMNDGSGQTVRDWSGRGNNGFLGATTSPDSNDPSWVKGVFIGSALRFDGLDDFVTIPDSSALEPSNITVSAWVRSAGSPGNYRYVMAKGANNCASSSYGLYTGNNAGLTFYVSSTDQFYLSPAAAPAAVWDGNWHNVAGTFDGSSVQLFVDGVAAGPATPTPGVSIAYGDAVQEGMIGSYPGGNVCNNQALTVAGDVDGVQIWSQALPVDTIWRTLKSLLTLAR
jgi:hypothetical protein